MSRPDVEESGGLRRLDFVMRRARVWLTSSVYRRSYALVLNTGINGLLGFGYWILAARIYAPNTVGVGAAGVAALLLVSSFGWLGVQPALLRFVPRGGRRSSRFVVASYVTASTAGLAVAACLAIALLFVSVRLSFLSSNALAMLAFFGAIVVWIVFTLEDAVLIGLRRSSWVPIENAIYGAIKIGLLAAFAFLSSPWSILGSWSLGAAIVIIPVNLVLFLRLLPEHARVNREIAEPFGVRDIVRFSLGNHVAGLLFALPDMLLPILVLTIAGARASAFFYAGWNIIYSMRLIAVNLGAVLTVEGAHDGQELATLNKRMAILASVIFVPLVVALLLGSRLILSLYGTEYVREGTTSLRLLALGLIPFAFTNLFVAADRVRMRVDRLLILSTVSMVTSLALSAILIGRLGVEGAAMGWLAAQTVTGLVLLIMIVRSTPQARSVRSLSRVE